MSKKAMLIVSTFIMESKLELPLTLNYLLFATDRLAHVLPSHAEFIKIID